MHLTIEAAITALKRSMLAHERKIQSEGPLRIIPPAGSLLCASAKTGKHKKTVPSWYHTANTHSLSLAAYAASAES